MSNNARKAPSTEAIFVRDSALAEEVDAWLGEKNASLAEGPRWTRADVVRTATRRFLRDNPNPGPDATPR